MTTKTLLFKFYSVITSRNVILYLPRVNYAFHHQIFKLSCYKNGNVFLSPVYYQFNNLRFKSKKSKGKSGNSDDLSDDEDNDSLSDDYPGIAEKDDQIRTVTVGSMRADLLLKVGLGSARNKIEEAFYTNKIRVNSRRIVKKSAHVNVGDEIDLIKGVYAGNTDFLTVARIEILDAEPHRSGDSIELKIRRSKSMVIENYPGGHPWKVSDVANS